MRAVLILESGSESGVEAALTVNRLGWKAIPADTDPFAVSSFLPRFEVVRPGTELFFVEDVKNLCREYEVAYILPTFFYGAEEVARRHAEFGNTRLLLSPSRTIRSTQDKLSYVLMAESLGMTDRIASTETSWSIETTFAKPRWGKGSRGARIVNSEEDARKLLEAEPWYVFQEYLPGPQFTVDVLTHPITGTGLQAAVRQVHRMRDGSDTVMDVLPEHPLEKIALEIAEGIGIRGIANIEFRMDYYGRHKAIDINARLSASHMASTVSGFPIVSALLNLAEGEKFKPYPLRKLRVYRHRTTHVQTEEARAHAQ